MAQLDVLVEAQSPLELRKPKVSAEDWETLGRDVGGRLLKGVPFTEPCFSNAWNSSECITIRNSYLDEGECYPSLVLGAGYIDVADSGAFEPYWSVYPDTMGNVPDVRRAVPVELRFSRRYSTDFTSSNMPARKRAQLLRDSPLCSHLLKWLINCMVD